MYCVSTLQAWLNIVDLQVGIPPSFCLGRLLSWFIYGFQPIIIVFKEAHSWVALVVPVCSIKGWVWRQGRRSDLGAACEEERERERAWNLEHKSREQGCRRWSLLWLISLDITSWGSSNHCGSVFGTPYFSYLRWVFSISKCGCISTSLHHHRS